MEPMKYTLNFGGIPPPNSFNTSSNSASKAGRKPNWTDLEIRTLLMEYDKNRDVMRSRSGGKDGEKKSQHSHEEKQRLWEQITAAVNKTRGAGMNLSGGTVCERTVKEVIKKWVNLVNKMRCDIAAQRRHPGVGICLISRAVNIILNTDEPLDMETVAAQTWTQQEVETNEPEEPPAVTVKSEEVEKIALNYRKIAPKLPNGIIIQSTVVNNLDDSESNKVTPTPSTPPRKRARTRYQHSSFNEAQNDEAQNDDEHVDSENGYTDFDTSNFTPTFDADYQTDHFMQLNKEILELKKRKLIVKIEKLVLDREKAEYDRDRSKIEKETAVLAQEKIQLEMETLKKTLEK